MTCWQVSANVPCYFKNRWQCIGMPLLCNTGRGASLPSVGHKPIDGHTESVTDRFFTATEYHCPLANTKLYWWQRHVWAQSWWQNDQESNLQSFKVQCLIHYITIPHTLKWYVILKIWLFENKMVTVMQVSAFKACLPTWFVNGTVPWFWWLELIGLIIVAFNSNTNHLSFSRHLSSNDCQEDYLECSNLYYVL